MAAPVVTPQQNRSTLRGKLASKKKKSLKQVLRSPYELTWPTVEKEVEADLLEKIKSELCKNYISPLKVPVQIRRNKQLVKKWREEQESKMDTAENKLSRSQVNIGINKVTKSLERDEVRLVIVDRDVPLMMTKHLIMLSATRGCPAVCLSGLSRDVGPAVNVKSVAAISIKKVDSSAYDDLVKYVASCAPRIEVPWLIADEEGDEEDIEEKEEEGEEEDEGEEQSAMDQSESTISTSPEKADARESLFQKSHPLSNQLDVNSKSADQNPSNGALDNIEHGKMDQQTVPVSTSKTTGYIDLSTNGPKSSSLSSTNGSGKKIYYAPADYCDTSTGQQGLSGFSHLYLYKSELNNPDDIEEFIPFNFTKERSPSPEPVCIITKEIAAGTTSTAKGSGEKLKVNKRKLDHPSGEDATAKIKLKKKAESLKNKEKGKKGHKTKYHKAKQMAQKSNPNRQKKKNFH